MGYWGLGKALFARQAVRLLEMFKPPAEGEE
jgi:hypothetical protein